MNRLIFERGMRLFLSALVLQATLPVVATAQDKETVAVLDFEGRGISQMESQTLTDRLSSELAKTNAMILVERNQMNEILGEQGFQQSGCTSAECAAEVGALLGVQHMIAGSFGKLGNSYTIDAKMFSVETGKTEKTVSATYKGEIDGLLTEIEILAWKIVGLNPPPELLAQQKAGVQPMVAAVAPAEEKGGGWLLWAVLGVAGAGAAAYFLMGQGGDEPLPGPPTLPE
ncbi:MAG: CsgG/HfaB family protein [Candidatus Neomarinimicrobiota bacterium]